jgi:hypothetical protein
MGPPSGGPAQEAGEEGSFRDLLEESSPRRSFNGDEQLPRLEKSEVASVITSSDAIGEKKLFCGKNLIGPPPLRII